jgi:sulfur-oxidizing protein SoxY
MRRSLSLIPVLIAATLAGPALALDPPRHPITDPYASGMWDYHQIDILGDPAQIAFDPAVIVTAPDFAEDSFNVPVDVDATALRDVVRIVVLVDYGPIPKILTFYPGEAEARLSLRFKIDQSTPIRAAVRTKDGAWHVGGTVIDAAGGGCNAPAMAYAADDWEQHLGEVHGRIWPETGRVRMIVDHPMDTGLADGIPVFILQTLALSTPDGRELTRIELSEPVNENPAFTVHFEPGTIGDAMLLTGRDNNGNTVRATLRAALTE